MSSQPPFFLSLQCSCYFAPSFPSAQPSIIPSRVGFRVEGIQLTVLDFMPSRVNVRVASQRLSQGLLATIGRTEEYHPRQTDATCRVKVMSGWTTPSCAWMLGLHICHLRCHQCSIILKEVQNEDDREKVGEGVPKNYALVR